MRLTLQPDTPLAGRYPTLGPDGARVMDVNGAGARIEIYFGRASFFDATGRCVRSAGVSGSTTSVAIKGS